MASDGRLVTILVVTVMAVTTLNGGVECSKILCLFPTASKSHVLGAQALMKNLATRGHEVTMVSSFPLSKPMKNYRDVYVPIEDAFNTVMASFMQGGSRNMMKVLPIVLGASVNYTNYTINSPQFRQLIKEEQFDVAIVGWFMNTFIVGVQADLKCPTILYWSAALASFINTVGNPTEISSVPHPMLGNKNPMTFFNRVQNTMIYVVDTLINAYFNYLNKPYYYANFPSEKGYPTYEEAKLNVSLVMVNTYFTQTVPRPFVPNMIEVGGLQIKSKPDPLPKEIQTWLDDAKDGAIFISFGSNLKSSNLRKDKFDAIIGTISKLKQRVIWKWDTEEMPGKPANVLIGKWLPQDDILAHKNLKLFLTHGGLGSITEAMYHGVPLVGIPMFGDQDTNMAQVVADGWGKAVSFDDLSEQGLTSAIQEVLGNAKYVEKVEAMASLYKDRPQSAMDLATFWVEYVARHKGAYHLHYQGANLNVLQRYLIDVLAFLGLVAFVIVKIITFLFRRLKALICGGARKVQKQKSN